MPTLFSKQVSYLLVWASLKILFKSCYLTVHYVCSGCCHIDYNTPEGKD